ncbi:hypothetical protein [Hyphobacterium sp.]|uniref:hypothetical protein n=1 Tax=Hyphobacterium sp. TaxID=2004662 RepID=UPI003BA87B06
MLRLILVIAAMTAGGMAFGGWATAEAEQTKQNNANMEIHARLVQQGGFTEAFQQAMESGNFRQAASLARSGDAMRGTTTRESGSGMATGRRTFEPVRATTSSASSSASTSLAANTPPPEPADYNCNSGNCACAGASDCVAMAPICVEGTIGCNDYGCTCQEATD